MQRNPTKAKKYLERAKQIRVLAEDMRAKIGANPYWT
jgi:hypothetical protein